MHHCTLKKNSKCGNPSSGGHARLSNIRKPGLEKDGVGLRDHDELVQYYENILVKKEIGQTDKDTNVQEVIKERCVRAVFPSVSAL
mmetsp:Transcript_19309/g.27102  ORF Transcript_19309/g.27102 Transcript_19309/m.27102 type:complete len:86 (-) Transcript_19309:343-600(-)